MNFSLKKIVGQILDRKHLC